MVKWGDGPELEEVTVQVTDKDGHISWCCFSAEDLDEDGSTALKASGGITVRLFAAFDGYRDRYPDLEPPIDHNW